MKPLLLEFCGLNSYAKPARVDFEALCSRGLFGIFGPTGSGKSTVLDAITIALYGRAPRVNSRDLSALICAQGDSNGKMTVRFTFAAWQRGQERRFRIERLYSLSGASKFRMVELRPEGDVVLAEKLGELNARVNELIGLSFEDFCRSVVLPQGEFSGFLKLGGRDRVEMIERLFSLEEYGNLLSERIAGRIRTQTARLDATEQLIREQGDISPEKTAALLAQVEKLTNDCALSENAARLSQTLYEMKQRLRQDCAALEEAETTLASLLSKKDSVEQARARLSLARKAALCAPLLSAAETARSTHRAAKETFERAAAARDQAQEQRSRTLSTLDEQEAALSEKKRAAQSRAAVLSSLEAGAREFDARRSRYGQLAETLKPLRVQRDQAKAALDAAEAAVQKACAACESLSSGEETAVDQGRYRKMLEGASLQKQSEKTAAQRSALEPRVLAAVKKDEAAQAAQDNAKQALAAAEETARRCRGECETFRVKLEQHRAKNAAAILAANLTDGTPCPVCGSVHHPCYAEPAEPLDASAGQRLSTALEQAETAVSACRDALDAARSAAADAHLQAETLLAQRKQLLETEQQQQAALTALSQETGCTAFSAAARQMEQAIETAARRAKALAEARTALSAQERQLSEASAVHQKAQSAAEQAEQNLSSLKEDLFERKALFDQHDVPFQRGTTAHSALAAALLSAQKEETDAASALESLSARRAAAEQQLQQALEVVNRADGSFQQAKTALAAAETTLSAALAEQAFPDESTLRAALLSPEKQAQAEQSLAAYDKALSAAQAEQSRLQSSLHGQRVSAQELSAAKEAAKAAQDQLGALREQLGKAQAQLEQAQRTLQRLKELQAQRKAETHQLDLLREISSLLRGRALVAFIAAEYMHRIAKDASLRLERLTRGRYALELGEENAFLVRDNGNGGILRPTSTLSGGETFLVSLSLALALSLQIGMKGQPMGLFFLDEGFGTLDDRLLAIVLDALETLRSDGLTVGVISHIPQLRERIGTRLLVEKDALSSTLCVEMD